MLLINELFTQNCITVILTSNVKIWDYYIYIYILCLVGFLVVGETESPSFFCSLYSCRMLIMVMGKWSDDSAC